MTYRNRRLLDLARGMLCQMQVYGVCNGREDTTVAAHSNMLMHGKGRGHKASDWAHCWACSACHTWYDQGPAPRAEKELAFLHGALRTYGALLESGKLEVV